jgi:hypothetical protein
MLPLILAGAIWTYNIVKIAQQVGSKKSDESGNVENEDNKNGEDSENITISNSAEAIKYLKNQQKSAASKKRDWSGGERYGK